MKLVFCAAHLLALCFSPVFSWDIGVAVGNQLQFLSKDGKLLGIAAEKYTDMAAMTFDPLHNHIYFSDSKDSQFSIFRLKLDNSSESKIIQPIVSRRHDDKEVQGVAFDAVTLSLFWSTGVGRTIQRLKLLSLFTAQPQEGETILQLDEQVPQGLAIDSCNRKLYWTNCNHKLATIESSDLDGQNNVRIVNEDLWQPLGITVDQHHQKLYWSDEQESFGFKIERSDLDGKNRETLITGSHHQPVALAIDLNFVYWSDWVHHAIWRSNLSIVNDIDLQPEQFRLYNNKIPNGVVSRTDLNYISKDSCSVLLELKRKIMLPPEEQAILNKIEDPTIDSKLLNYCLNNGSFHINGTCVCPKGYSGQRCEVSLCHNYCILGECSLDQDGYPSCACPMNRTGLRCQTDLCYSICLNGGSCVILGVNKTECQCPSGFFGKRCEMRSAQQDELCKAYCNYYAAGYNYQHLAKDDKNDGVLPLPPPSCSCDEIRNSERYEMLENSTKLQVASLSDYSIRNLNMYLTSSLGIICAVLLIVIVLLSIKICSLNKRPRVKKRYVVNKAVTPMTSRPAVQQPSESCEITIENCCNMNICETPCFEPDFRNAKSSVIHRKSKEEKANLLSDMEVESQDESLY